PFVDADHTLHQYFLPREYSVILPGVAALVVLLCIAAQSLGATTQPDHHLGRGALSLAGLQRDME
ncbi:hypothetical protein CRUP_005486, partial [Coryphaenoides rupestris]